MTMVQTMATTACKSISKTIWGDENFHFQLNLCVSLNIFPERVTDRLAGEDNTSYCSRAYGFGIMLRMTTESQRIFIISSYKLQAYTDFGNSSRIRKNDQFMRNIHQAIMYTCVY